MWSGRCQQATLGERAQDAAKAWARTLATSHSCARLPGHRPASDGRAMEPEYGAGGWRRMPQRSMFGKAGTVTVPGGIGNLVASSGTSAPWTPSRNSPLTYSPQPPGRCDSDPQQHSRWAPTATPLQGLIAQTDTDRSARVLSATGVELRRFQFLRPSGKGWVKQGSCRRFECFFTLCE